MACGQSTQSVSFLCYIALGREKDETSREHRSVKSAEPLNEINLERLAFVLFAPFILHHILPHQPSQFFIPRYMQDVT